MADQSSFSAISNIRDLEGSAVKEERRRKKSRKRSIFAGNKPLTYKRVSRAVHKAESLPTLKGQDLREIEDHFSMKFITYLGNRQIVRKLGSGRYGTTFLVCENRRMCAAIKVQVIKDRRNLEHELEMQEVFHKAGLAPAIRGKPYYYRGRVYDSEEDKYSVEDVAIIEMDVVHGTLEHFIEKNELDIATLDDVMIGLFRLLASLRTHNLTHGDMHSGNIAYNVEVSPEGQLVMNLSLIDFGKSTQNGHDTLLEATQLYRTLVFFDEMPDTSHKYFKNVFKRFLEGNYKRRKFPFEDEDKFEKLYLNLIRKQHEKIKKLLAKKPPAAALVNSNSDSDDDDEEYFSDDDAIDYGW